jgi:hypothetical protein
MDGLASRNRDEFGNDCEQGEECERAESLLSNDRGRRRTASVKVGICACHHPVCDSAAEHGDHNCCKGDPELPCSVIRIIYGESKPTSRGQRWRAATLPSGSQAQTLSSSIRTVIFSWRRPQEDRGRRCRRPRETS